MKKKKRNAGFQTANDLVCVDINPVAFLQPRHHDNGARSLFPDHPPEVGERLRQRSLRGDVSPRATVAVHVVGVDVVASRDTATFAAAAVDCGHNTSQATLQQMKTSAKGSFSKCQTPSKTQTNGRTDEETRLFVRPFVRLFVRCVCPPIGERTAMLHRNLRGR